MTLSRTSINYGAAANDGTGDTLRGATIIIDSQLQQLYNIVNNSGNGVLDAATKITFRNNLGLTVEGGINASSPVDGDTLTYVAANGRFEAVAGGGGGGSTTLDGLTDVTITGVTTNEVLIYNGSVWVNDALAAVALTGAYADLSGTPTVPTVLNNLSAATGNYSMGGYEITSLLDPTTAQSAATKAYVDATAAGLNPKTSCSWATTAALPACTYANGASGVGATLTGNANGALTSQDGVAIVVNQRGLVKNQAAPENNGIYTVTTVGTAGTPFVLTRATDDDAAADATQAYTFILGGTTLANTSWTMNTSGSITVGTTAQNWVQYSAATSYSAGANISITGANIIGKNIATVINITDAAYGAVGDGTTDNTTAIQAALDAAYAAGGGIVYVPVGTFGVKYTSSASHGALQIKDNVMLVGAGMGASVIKLLSSQGASDLTGIIRTPSGTQNKKVTIRDLTVDGNLANCTGRVIGLFFGVSPSEAVTVSVAGTTATATTVSGSHGLTTGHTYYLINGDNVGLTGNFVITSTGSNTFTFPVASGTASDPTGYTWFYPADGGFNYIADEDILLERVECKNCYAYAFDPHERVVRLTIKDCISHDNGGYGGGTSNGDGITMDGIFDSVVDGCYFYDNVRNGINIVTGSSNIRITNTHAWGNGQYGFAIQRGSSLINRSKGISFFNSTSRNNTAVGARLQMTIDTKLIGCDIFENGQEGIKIEGALNTIIQGSTVKNNGQTTHNTYNEIYAKEYVFSADGVTYGTKYTMGANNYLSADLTLKSKYLIQEADDSSNYNKWIYNLAGTNGATGGFSIPGGNPNSISVTA